MAVYSSRGPRATNTGSSPADESNSTKIRGPLSAARCANFFSLGARRYHELSFIYELIPESSDLLDPSWTSSTTDGGTTIFFQWFPLNHLKEVNLKPEFLRHSLQEPHRTTRHLMIREELNC